METQSPLILIVDDNREIRELIHYGLKRDYRILLAENGADALEKIEGQTPDLVITDLMMPEMNGMDLLHKIRENKFLKTVPVIFLSARNTIEAQVQALEAGAEVFVIKPFKMELLKAQIKTLLASRQRS
jgi:DNA-binding response OmpR family regulator